MNSELSNSLRLAKQLAFKEPNFLVATAVNKALEKRRSDIFRAFANYYLAANSKINAVTSTAEDETSSDIAPYIWCNQVDGLFDAYPMLHEYVRNNLEQVNKMLNEEGGFCDVGATLQLNYVTKEGNANGRWFSLQNSHVYCVWEISITF